MGPVAMSLDAYGAYHRERAELWERQALLKARAVAGDRDVGARFMDWAGRTVYRAGVDERVLPAIRGMKREIDRALRGRHAEASARNVKLGRGGSARSSSSCRRCSSSTAATIPGCASATR